LSQTDPPPPAGNFGPLVFLVAGFAMIDLMTPTALRGSLGGVLVGAVILGVIAGQGGFLAFWAVLGPHRPLVRFSVALATAGALHLVLAIGMGLHVVWNGTWNWGWEWQMIRDFLAGLLVLPLLALAPLGPVWIRKWLMGCRMIPRLEMDPAAGQAAEPSGDEEDPYALSSARQFTLAQILAVTTFVAVALGLAGSFVQINMAHNQADEAWQIWFGLFIGFFFLVLASALVVLPCMWAALIVRSRVVSAVIFAAHTGILSLALIVTGIFLSVPLNAEVLVALILFTGSMTCTLFISLQTIRHCGYELSWPRKRAADTALPPTRRAFPGIFEEKSKPWPEDAMSPFAWLAIVLLCADLVVIPLGAWTAYDIELMAFGADPWFPLIGLVAGLGVLAGQAGFLAVWAVFGPELFSVRLLRSTGATLLPCGALMASWAHGLNCELPLPILVSGFFSVFFFLPFFLLCVQLPVWIFRPRGGCCPTASGQGDTALARTYKFEPLFSISVILAALLFLISMMVVALLGEAAVSHVASGWFDLLTLCVALSFWSVFMIWPCIWVTLLPRSRLNFGLWLFSCTVVTSVMTIPVLGILGIVFNLTAAAVLFGCLRFVGNRGYFPARPE